VADTYTVKTTRYKKYRFLKRYFYLIYLFFFPLAFLATFFAFFFAFFLAAMIFLIPDE
jgi:hypothetical protein